ncbi:MAG: hypothetical protein ACR2NB_13190 [Solirubrobacteraceae bacterium]
MNRNDRRADIVQQFGKPQSDDDIRTEGVKGVPKSALSQSCIHYGRQGKLASLYQFCFNAAGKYQSKASY